MNDAQWLSELHAHGLLRLSFVPPKEIRELRLLARYRTRLVADHTSVRNRTIKVIEVAGIKLSSVVSDSFGKTGRALPDALAEGTVYGSPLMHKNLVKLERVAQDGIKVRASVGTGSFRSGKRLRELREIANEQIRVLKQELEQDGSAGSRRREAARLRAAEDQRRRIEEALAELPDLRSCAS